MALLSRVYGDLCKIFIYENVSSDRINRKHGITCLTRGLSMSTPTFTTTMKVQNEMAKRVILENTQKNKIYICGVDVAYRDNIAYCSAVLMNKDSMKVKHSINLTLSVKHHYAPSFFMLRESEHFDIVKKPF